VNQSTPSPDADIPYIITSISSHCRNAALNGLLHPLSYKSRPAVPPHSGSSATCLHTCQQPLRPFNLRILDLNEYFHNHTYSQPETSCSRYGRTNATDTLGIPQAFHLALLTPLGFSTSHEVYSHTYVI